MFDKNKEKEKQGMANICWSCENECVIEILDIAKIILSMENLECKKCGEILDSFNYSPNYSKDEGRILKVTIDWAFKMADEEIKSNGAQKYYDTGRNNAFKDVLAVHIRALTDFKEDVNIEK